MFPSVFSTVWLLTTRGPLWFKSFTRCNILLNTTYKLVYSMQTNQLALEHFRAVKTEKPRSKVAFLRGLYAEIVASSRVASWLTEFLIVARCGVLMATLSTDR